MATSCEVIIGLKYELNCWIVRELGLLKIPARKLPAFIQRGLY